MRSATISRQSKQIAFSVLKYIGVIKIMCDNDFSTVEKIIKYVEPLVNTYRQFPSKKDSIVKQLDVIFNTKSPYLYKVVIDSAFVATFRAKMGLKRMRALKKLLYAIDKDYYSNVDFLID